ncbi:RNA polymerase II degradation factor 1-like isoform X2 [Trichoplusia ni]|uniref:RNA polymerase II degradation factor 1-like isoform X2 n=1 Tax=Trichoplusia ni TaxID=7111 RepID=A0A7E5VLR3_TRINI|nr:RNA polymerase II degradation factor 1-like isoform X2 [Trichoplusia ni]
MGSVKTWSTKEEVLKDLAKASGRRIGNLDDGYLVVGDGPPPIIVEDDDFEMRLMFGDTAATGRKSMPSGNDSPDLLGIQQMLQMVKDYSDEEEETVKDTQSSDCVISITKGNDKKTEEADNSKNDSNVKIDHKSIDVNANSANKDEYEEIATKLKNKISDAAKSDTFELKKQKNVAIATLLRLYANNKSPSNEVDSSIKLIKPDFFKSSHPLSSSATSTPEPKDDTQSTPAGSSASRSSTPAQTPSENNSSESNTTKPKVKLDPEMRSSIEKVSKWLEEPTKKKSKPVYLNPIAFKRKEITPPSSSPSMSETKPSPKRNITNDKQQYKPSDFASDLGKKYMERSKILEAKQNEVTWSNLDKVLKQKDMLIKKRLQETQSQNNDTSLE